MRVISAFASATVYQSRCVAFRVIVSLLLLLLLLPLPRRMLIKHQHSTAVSRRRQQPDSDSCVTARHDYTSADPGRIHHHRVIRYGVTNILLRKRVIIMCSVIKVRDGRCRRHPKVKTPPRRLSKRHPMIHKMWRFTLITVCPMQFMASLNIT